MNKITQLTKGKYRFAATNENYEDYSSGRVLYGTSGATNFPVRLSSEIFQRCKNYLEESGSRAPYVVWDAFCGAAYSMTVLGFLHGSDIKTIFASDSDENILETAVKNLGLLSEDGMNQRIEEIRILANKYNKDSHKEALESAQRLKLQTNKAINTKVFQFNVLSNKLPSNVGSIDMVIVDLPYGQLVDWSGLEEGQEPVQIFLDNIEKGLSKNAVVAIVSSKKQKFTYDGYDKLKSFTLGKRKVWFMRPSLNTT